MFIVSENVVVYGCCVWLLCVVVVCGCCVWLLYVVVVGGCVWLFVATIVGKSSEVFGKEGLSCCNKGKVGKIGKPGKATGRVVAEANVVGRVVRNGG